MASGSLEPVRQIAAHELVLDQLRRSLDHGQFRPGDRLPLEKDLTEMLDVSRVTLRTAIAVLEREGRLEVRRGRGGGFWVLDRRYDPAEERLRLRRDRAAVRKAFEFRAIVESGSARLAAQRRRAADLPRLRTILSRLDQTISAARVEPSASLVADFQILDGAFHLGIAQATGNEEVVRAVDSARRTMWLPGGSVFGHIEDNANDHHAEILEAIADRDAELAASVMSQHIESTRRTVESWLKR